MKLVTFVDPEGAEHAGEVRGGEAVAFRTGTVRERLASGDRTPADGERFALADVTLLAPVPQPRAIFGIGRNYAAHAAELGNALPDRPLVFLKLPSSSTGPDGPVVRPVVTEKLDYEAELVVVLGPNATIAGWAVANDVTARDLQELESQWTRAKAFDTSCPWGPWITTGDELPDPLGLRVTSHVNGELRQDGSTADLIFKPHELVEFLSAAITLEPGDVILTGTPAGVGHAMTPPRYLEPGDAVRVEVEHLGALAHRVAAPVSAAAGRGLV